MNFQEKEVVLQRVANKMIVTYCYLKFNTEVAICKFFEKPCHLIIEVICKKPRGKKIIIFKSKNLNNLLT